MSGKTRGKCYCCGRTLGVNPYIVKAEDGKGAWVGSDCYETARHLGQVGAVGPKGGRVWVYPIGATQDEWKQRYQEAKERQQLLG